MTDQTSPGSMISTIQRYALPVLTITLGLQLLYAFIPGVAWYLRDVKSVGTLSLLPYALPPFVLALFAGILRRVLGARMALWTTSGGVAVLRFGEQVSRNSEIDLWLSIAGVALFFIFLSLFIGHCRSLGLTQSRRWVFGFMFGFAIELSLRALFGFRSLNSINGIAPIITVAVLSGGTLIMLWREPYAEATNDSDVELGSALSLVILGPLLMLQVLLLGTHGLVGEVADLNPNVSFSLVMLGYSVSLVGIYLGFWNPRNLHPLPALIFALFLGLSGYFAADSGRFFIPAMLIAQGYAGYGLALIGAANSEGSRQGLARTSVMIGAGMILFIILGFGFYMAQDIALPFPRSLFPAVAGAITGLVVLQAAVRVHSKAATSARIPEVLFAAMALLLLPLTHWGFSGQDPLFGDPTENDVSIMTYNIHSGINAYGQPGLEAIAGVIEDSGTDIVGLQEVSRGRFMDGFTDIPYWLAQRLDMAYVFQGTEEPNWGNAILSRYPILEWGWADLPRAGQLIGRGYLWARIDTGGPEPILVIVTHLHHLVPDSQARQQQVPSLLQFWNGQSYTVLLGDLNAEPGSPEMNMIFNAGLNDAWNAAGGRLGYTFPSLSPTRRIDWLWHSNELVPIQTQVIQTEASDHLPVYSLFNFR